MKKKNRNLLTVLWVGHPRVAIAITLIVINLLVILFFTGVLSLVSGNSFIDELAYIFTYTMCSDGVYDFVNNQEDLICFILKICLAFIQMIIFSGALIGFTTDIIQSTIDKRLNNLGNINLTNHYVFLNWSSIGPQIIYDLSFLEGSKNVLILCEEDREEVLNSIQSIFVERKRKMRNLRVFIKTGSPNSVKHLDSISIQKAKYIGILLGDEETNTNTNMPINDLNSLKILLNILKMTPDSNIVVETESSASVEKIESLLTTINKDLSKRIIVFSHNDVLGFVLGRAVINSTFATLYQNLLSYDGCEFYGVEPQDIEEALLSYNDCIPIINYDDDDEVDENGNKAVEHLYILSDTSNTLGVRSEKKKMVKELKYSNEVKRDNFTLFVISDNEYPSVIIEEIERYKNEYNVDIKIHLYDYKDDITKVADVIKQTSGKRKLLLLSSKDRGASQDANIFLTAMALKIEGCLLQDIEVLAEIVNPLNYNSLKNIGVMSVILSNKIISLFMLQLLTHPGSKRFYRDVISTNGDENGGVIDFDIVKVGEVLEFKDKLTFNCQSELVQSFYYASNKTKMLIGVRYADKKEIRYLADLMDVPEEIVLTAEDELVVVCY